MQKLILGNPRYHSTAVLGLSGPWDIERVETKLESGEVHVWVGLRKGKRWVCP